MKTMQALQPRINELRKHGAVLQERGAELSTLHWPKPEADWISQRIGQCAKRVQDSNEALVHALKALNTRRRCEELQQQLDEIDGEMQKCDCALRRTVYLCAERP